MTVSIGIIGCTGRMGELLQTEINQFSSYINGIGFARDLDSGVSLEEVFNRNDVIVDFSNAELIEDILNQAIKTPKPLVICTTGWNKEKIEEKLNRIADLVPVVIASNTSIGACMQRYIVSKVASILDEAFDIDIHEKHHHYKIDSPSGTAKTLYLDIQKSKEVAFGINYDLYRVESEVRQPHKIGVSVARSGGIVGVHDVSFTSETEMLTISHIAFDRRLFAKGALKAISFVHGLKDGKGLYSMYDVLGLEE